ncbi:hypothetical protein D3C81_1821970 [compost metagenome]
MAADEAELVALGAGQFHFHLHLDAGAEADPRVEEPGRIAIPIRRADHQEAPEGDVVQLRCPAIGALGDFRGGVEVDAVEAPTFVGGFTHDRAPARFQPL